MRRSGVRLPYLHQGFPRTRAFSEPPPHHDDEVPVLFGARPRDGDPLRAQEPAKSPFWNSLTPAHHAKLNAGRPVVIEEEVAGNPWPRFTIYQLVKASPSQVAAVFWDCEKDPEYIPNCIKVSVLSRPSPNVVEAEYTLKMPFLIPDEVYVSRNEIHRGPDGIYDVSWKVVRSRYTKACSGTLRFEEHDGGTLIRYSRPGRAGKPHRQAPALKRLQAGRRERPVAGGPPRRPPREAGKHLGEADPLVGGLPRTASLNPSRGSVIPN